MIIKKVLLVAVSVVGVVRLVVMVLLLVVEVLRSRLVLAFEC
jgi:hypothetical protein